jgi:hypothetical protein
MDDALGVRRVQRRGDLNGEFQHLGQRERAPLQALGQRLPLQELHHQVIDLVLAADVVQRADVGVVQGRDGFGFPLQALPRLGSAGGSGANARVAG